MLKKFPDFNGTKNSLAFSKLHVPGTNKSQVIRYDTEAKNVLKKLAALSNEDIACKITE